MAESDDVKPGYKTTEFWLSTVAALAGILYASGAVHPGGAADHWLGLLVSALSALGYSVSRGMAKK